MGRPKGALQALLLRAEVDVWLEERNNPAPMLRQVAAQWRGMGTDVAVALAWEAERHAQLWDNAYRLSAVVPWNNKSAATLAATMAELERLIQAQPQLYPAAIEHALSGDKNLSPGKITGEDEPYPTEHNRSCTLRR